MSLVDGRKVIYQNISPLPVGINFCKQGLFSYGTDALYRVTKDKAKRDKRGSALRVASDFISVKK